MWVVQAVAKPYPPDITLNDKQFMRMKIIIAIWSHCTPYLGSGTIVVIYAQQYSNKYNFKLGYFPFSETHTN